MVHSVFLYLTDEEFDVEATKRYLEARPDVILDPLGTSIYLVCGGPDAVAVCRDERIAEPDRFPNVVLVTVQPDVVNVFQEYGDAYDLRSARDFVCWLIEQQRCLIKDEYSFDWTEQVSREGVGALYPPQLDQ
jgi:hypothetical protein